MKSREYSHAEKISVIMDYYEKIQVQLDSDSSPSFITKSRDDVEKILRRYDNEFPRLVSRLEQKYNFQFDVFAAVPSMKTEL